MASDFPSTQLFRVEGFLHSVKGLKKVQLFGKQDPYAKIIVNGRTVVHKTKPVLRGNTEAEWKEGDNNSFSFEVDP